MVLKAFPSACRRGNCKKAGLGLVCEVGLRCRTYYVLCGSVLSVWTKVEGVLASVSGTNVKMQIVRLRTEDGQRIVGGCLGCSSAAPQSRGGSECSVLAATWVSLDKGV